MLMNDLTFAPYHSRMESEVLQLFRDYSHKDHQLRIMGIPKERMIKYLGKNLSKPTIQSICLMEKGRLIGLIVLQALPWMSKHFGLKMFAVPHLLANSKRFLGHLRLLRYVIEELYDVDFLDCRVAVDDIYSAHALEICDFRYVGTEMNMGQFLKPEGPPDLASDYEIRPCMPQERDQVIEIAADTHIHNRFVYDPAIHESLAKSLYRNLVANCFEEDQFNVLVAHSRGMVYGFIISKMNLSLSQEVGQLYASLDFIGVRPEARNKGIGIALNQWALYHLWQKNVAYVAVRTFGSNYSAMATCLRTGFKITSTSLHFHKWIRRPAIHHELLPSYPHDVALNRVMV
jgi:ribosomal protein S18 acetylase RimI-like enzyme